MPSYNKKPVIYKCIWNSRVFLCDRPKIPLHLLVIKEKTIHGNAKKPTGKWQTSTLHENARKENWVLRTITILKKIEYCIFTHLKEIKYCTFTPTAASFCLDIRTFNHTICDFPCCLLWFRLKGHVNTFTASHMSIYAC
jgi:hypothetical protein